MTTPAPADPRRGIAAWAGAEPDRPALVLDGAVRTYGTLVDRATRLARALADDGIGPADRIAIMLPNGFELFETWAAATQLQRGGGVDQLAPQGRRARVHPHGLGREGPRRPRRSRGVLSGGARSRAGLPRPDGGWRARFGRGRLRGRDRGIGADVDGIEGTAELVGLGSPIFYTSGTTGRPKGVVHGRPDPGASARNMEGQAALWGWTQDDTYILSGPAYHAGPGGWTMTALYVGAPTVILRAFDPVEWLRLVDTHRVTCSFMVPSHFIRILEVPAGGASRAGPLVPAADRPRRRTVPGRREAPDHRGARAL